jgi:hypothetical protein
MGLKGVKMASVNFNGMFYKTFYGRDFNEPYCKFSYCNSPPTKFNIFGQGLKSTLDFSPVKGSTLSGSNLACKCLTKVEMDDLQVYKKFTKCSCDDAI